MIIPLSTGGSPPPTVPGQVSTTAATVSISTTDFGNRAVGLVSAYGASSTASTGQVSVPVSAVGTQLLIVRDAGGIARGLTLSTISGQGPAVTTPNAQSTATALLFLTPGVTTVDSAETRQRVATLKQLPCYGTLVTLLAARLGTASLDDVITSDAVASARTSCSASLSIALANERASQASLDLGLSFITRRESITNDGNHLREEISNTGYRVVDIIRWQPSRDAKGVPIATVVQSDMVGAQAISLSDIFQSGSPNSVTDDITGPAASTFRYYIFGSGLFDNLTGAVLPSGMPQRTGIDDARLFGESILAYSIGPIIEIAVGAKIAPADWASKLGFMWAQIQNGIDLSKTANQLASGNASAVRQALLENAQDVAKALTQGSVLQKAFPNAFQSIGVMTGLVDVLDEGFALGNIAIMAGTYASAQRMSVLEVTAPPGHLVLPSPVPPIEIGLSRPFVGTITDVFGNPTDQGSAPIDWHNLNADIAYVDQANSPTTTLHAVSAGTATIIGRVQGVPTQVSVTVLKPSDVPQVGANPSQANFAAERGAASPSNKSVQITNVGGGDLGNLSLDPVLYGSGEASGWLTTMRLSETTAPTSLVLGVSSSNLSLGVYHATVTVRGSNALAANHPAIIPLTLTITTPAAAPKIVLDQSALFPSAAAGQIAPAQIVQVTNGGTGTLSGLSVGTINYGAGQPSGWVSTSWANGTTDAPATLSLSYATSSLAVGTYTATIPVRSSATGVVNSPQNVSVTLTISQPTAAPRISVSPTSATFGYTIGGTAPAQQNGIQISNSGTGTLNGLAVGSPSYQSGQPTGWLTTASLNSAVAPATLTLGVAPGTLTQGTYHVSVPITSSATGVVNSPQTVGVDFVVSPAPPPATTPSIALDPASLTPSTVQGQPASLQLVNVTNGGTGTLSGLSVGTVTYGAGQPSGWLSTSWTAGTTAPTGISVSYAVSSLAVGTYTATIPVLSSATGVTNSPRSIGVTLTITPPTPPAAAPSIALDPASLTPSTVQGQPASLQLVNVTNGGTGTLSGLSIGTIAYGAGQPSGWITTNWTSGTTAPTGISVSYAVSSLAAGTYTATIPVLSSAAGVTNSPRSIGVMLTITSPPPPPPPPPPANPVITSVSTNPSPPRAHTQFSVTIGGSNFDPQTAQMVFTGPGCPLVTSCVVPNGVLTSKTTNSIVGPATLASGDFSVQVQNGTGGAMSNIGLVHVP